MKIKLRDNTKWHNWFAWHPVQVGSELMWLCNIQRRDVCSEGAAWACAPIWEYRAKNDPCADYLAATKGE